MKRLSLILVLIFAATTLLAGEGKSCDAHKTKSVSLTGTIATNAEGGKVFRVSDSGKSIALCHKTNADLLALGKDGATLQIKGKVVACDESEGEELVIESAKRV
jgi:hypothetical protein